ncbi:MAG: FKBP-type peptidyl-prolyl cis-trans isomerase [Ekhidna sp.]
MKNLLPFLFLVLLFACQTESSESTQESVTYDTIRTGTGLQYYYLKKGEGRQIKDGSLVAAYNRLYLNDIDTVFWASEDNEDSTFSFIQGKTSLIKGALELYPLLREGDELVAIIPDSLGYGKEDNRGLPGGSTLVFNPIIIRSVSAPKEMLSDTLIATVENGSVEDVMDVYQSIASSELKDNYHMGLEHIRALFTSLEEPKRFSEIEELAIAFEAIAEDNTEKQGFRYSKVNAALSLLDTTKAVGYLNEIIEQDPEESFWKDMLERIASPPNQE